MSSGTLDTNTKGATAAELTLTTETKITLYVVAKTGQSGNHLVGVEVSPDGSTWVGMPGSVRGLGCLSYDCVASKVRAIVIEAEGSSSNVIAHILAR